MEFGRTSSLDNILLDLPENHPGTLKVLGGKKAEKCLVHVGCPIWADTGFIGKIYPKKPKSKDIAKYYSYHFNSIELNISHYKLLDINTIQHWVDTTYSDFKFCPKINQIVSHTPFIKPNSNYMKEIMATNKHFNHKLGMPFLQLPPHYDSTKIHDLLDFCDEVSLSRCAIELRHESWFNNENILKTICNYFYKNNITFLITDTVGRRDVLHQRLTTKTAFIRFVANDLHQSDYIRMNAWIDRLQQWIDNGLEELFFFIHTPSHEFMPEITTYFLNTLKQKTGINIRLPKIIIKSTSDNKLF